ncbi:MAG: 50S ribosomal protein L25/general stress protein Ctc [Bacteroidia bacterium]
MKTTTLKAEKRSVGTKGQINQLRKSGFVPGNIYGEDKNIQIKVDERHLKKIIYTPDTYLIELEVENEKYPVIMKEVQFHKVTDRPIHIDFQLVNENKPVQVSIPVVTKGQAEGVKAGGKLHLSMRRVKVKGLVKNIPDALEIDITNLGVGKTITCGDIKINGVTLLHPENLAIVGVKVTRNVVETETSASAATPQTAAPAAGTSASTGAPKK